jgi:hypothetical protein
MLVMSLGQPRAPIFNPNRYTVVCVRVSWCASAGVVITASAAGRLGVSSVSRQSKAASTTATGSCKRYLVVTDGSAIEQ